MRQPELAQTRIRTLITTSSNTNNIEHNLLHFNQQRAETFKASTKTEPYQEKCGNQN